MNSSNTSTDLDVRLGDYVQDDLGRRGRVTAKHDSFSRTGEQSWWLEGQTIPVANEEREGRWVSVLLHGGGAILVPEGRITVIEPFPFENPWASHYFREQPPAFIQPVEPRFDRRNPQYTVVQHSGHDSEPGFTEAVESACVGTTLDHNAVLAAGGLFFANWADAETFCESANYPPQVQGLIPQAAGHFSAQRVGGLCVYIPIRRVVG